LTGPELVQMSAVWDDRITHYWAPLEESGAALMAFGPGAGEGGIAGYKFHQDNADRILMRTDMGPVVGRSFPCA